MKHATTSANVITGLFSGPQAFATSEVPDNVDIGWESVNGVWQKGAVLVAKEADALDRLTKRANLSPSTVATLRQWAADAAGTTATSGNAVVVLNTMLPRLGTFFNRLADMIEAQRLDQQS